MLAQLDGTHLLIANLLYGGGLRLMEVLRLRVLDVGFGGNAEFTQYFAQESAWMNGGNVHFSHVATFMDQFSARALTHRRLSKESVLQR